MKFQDVYKKIPLWSCVRVGKLFKHGALLLVFLGESMSKSTVTMRTFVVGLVIAILVASAVSSVVSTQFARGPQGQKGDTGATGVTGGAGATGAQGKESVCIPSGKR